LLADAVNAGGDEIDKIIRSNLFSPLLIDNCAHCIFLIFSHSKPWGITTKEVIETISCK